MKQLSLILGLTLLISFSFSTFAQKEKEVKIKTEYGTIYGSLLAPKGSSTATIIIPGSGPTDRNGNSIMAQTNTYQYLAEGLAEEGVASLRYDKLGIGKSSTKLEEKDLFFEQNSEVVIAIIDYLKKQKYKDIVIIGHSEGSLIGMLTAQKREISKFISIAGLGERADLTLIRQIGEQNPSLVEEMTSILASLKQGEMVDEFSPELAPLFRKSVQPYLISWLKYDPKEEIGKVKTPILIVQGTTDFQVKEDQAQLLSEGNPSASLEVIQNMNHILKVAPEDRGENQKTYYQAKLPLHKELLPVLLRFIRD